MLILRKGGAIAEIYLDDGLVRMAKKYHINPENWMKAALIEHIHTKAIAHNPWGKSETDLWEFVSKNMEDATEALNLVERFERERI